MRMCVDMKRTGHGNYNRGRWQVERERSRLEDSAPPVQYRDASPIGRVIPKVMKRLGLEDQHWLGVLEGEWPNLVGKAVAKHTRPGRFEKKRLFVFVDSSVWLSELARYSRGKMLSNLQKRFGKDKIKSICLQLNPDK